MKNKILLIIFTILCIFFVGCEDEKDPVTPPKKDTYTITVENAPGTGDYAYASQLTITAPEVEGKNFLGWQCNGEIINTNLSHTFIIIKDQTFTALYETIKCTLTVNGGSGSGTYDYGTVVTVTPTLNEKDEFIGWKNGVRTVSSNQSYTFTIKKDTTLTANIFTPVSYESYCKTLTKKTNQDFKVLLLTDIQLHDNESTDITFNVIDTLINENNPDLICFLGDLLNDSKTYKSLINYKAVLDKIDSYGIPWAPVFGNHDYEDYGDGSSKKTTTSNDLINYYKTLDNCLFTLGPSNISGKSNYFINIVDETSKELVETIYLMDSRLGGFDEASVSFYRNAVMYNKELNKGIITPSVLLCHIALNQYGDAYEYSKSVEYRDLTGLIGRDPCDLASGTKNLFPLIQELGSTKMVVCGHDHENSYYTEYQGITLAYALKSSEGDDHKNYCRIGGTMLSLGEGHDSIEYKPVDFEFEITNELDLALESLPFWKYSGAKLVFDIEMPSSGTIRYSLMGTNTALAHNDYKYQVGAWNRLTKNITFNASTKTVNYGTLTHISGNKYHYVLDLADAPLNTDSGEVACGEETLRLFYFSKASNTFKFSNMHYEYEEITETNQIDLSTALVDLIPDQFYQNGSPVKVTPKVMIGNTTLVNHTDILYYCENNREKGTAKVTIVPSATGAHKYKGSITVTYNIITNPDDDTISGHEDAIILNSDYYPVKDEFVKVKDWHNNKVLHIEVKRLSYGTVTSGETARICFMGTNENSDAREKGNNWARFSGYYIIDFSNNSVVIYEQGKPSNILATGTSLGDGWFSIEINLNDVSLNTAEGTHGNDLETLERLAVTNITRSFKLDNCYIK